MNYNDMMYDKSSFNISNDSSSFDKKYNIFSNMIINVLICNIFDKFFYE